MIKEEIKGGRRGRMISAGTKGRRIKKERIKRRKIKKKRTKKARNERKMITRRRKGGWKKGCVEIERTQSVENKIIKR